MRKIPLQLFLLIAISIFAHSCVKDKVQTTYTYLKPVYQSKETVWQNIKSAAPQSLQNTGKLFLYGKYIFINEVNKGVHVIDNSTPQLPKNIAFIAIPGNVDIAVKNNTLYADLFADMATIDITIPTAVALKKISNNVFPERQYSNGFLPDSTKYIVDWIKVETTNKKDLEAYTSPGGIVFYSPASMYNSSSSTAAAMVGVSGSMSRFTIVNNYLYTVGNASLTAFDIASPNEPVKKQVQNLGWNIETIYALKDKLFIGSQTGMLIYTITNPATPTFEGSFAHACRMDPVIADDKYAYITLRAMADASSCWGTVQTNELDIVDIASLTQSTLVKTYNMTEPKGLSKDGNYLFVCDGKAGLKIYDAANVMALKKLKVITGINPFDVICQGGLAIVVANEGIFQYDYTDINNVRLLSKIAIKKN